METGILYVIIVILTAVIFALIAGILRRYEGQSIVNAIFTGAGAFTATVGVLVMILVALGHLQS